MDRIEHFAMWTRWAVRETCALVALAAFLGTVMIWAVVIARAL